MKVLKSSQERAEHAVEVARLKAQKLKEIDKLKEIELLQEQIFLDTKVNKQIAMKRIRDDIMNIKRDNKKEVPIEAVFDNTIAAIKRRIESKQNASQIIDLKNAWKLKNEQRRNKILEIERQIKEHIKKFAQDKFAHMKLNKVKDEQSIQLKISQARKRLSQLEEAENKMIKKLSNTKALEFIHVKASAYLLNAIEAKKTPLSVSNTPSGSRLIERPWKRLNKSSIDDCSLK